MGRPSDVDRELCFAPYDEIYGTDDTDDVLTFWPRGPFEVDGIRYDASEALYNRGGDRAMMELIEDCVHDRCYDDEEHGRGTRDAQAR